MIVLPLTFEAQVAEACGLSELNVDPGSLRVDELSAENVTVRFTVVTSIPQAELTALIRQHVS